MFWAAMVEMVGAGVMTVMLTVGETVLAPRLSVALAVKL